MEERSPGGFSPTKWAQFANSPPAWAPRASGGRGRAAAAPARARRSPPPGARSRPDFPGGGGEAEGEGKAAAGSGCFFFSFGPFLGLPPHRQGPSTAGNRSPAGRAGGRGQRVKPPPRPAQTSTAVCSPNPHPGRHPRPPLSSRGARFSRPPRRRGETSRLRYGARFSRRLCERWRRWRRHWENGGRAPFPSPPLI